MVEYERLGRPHTRYSTSIYMEPHDEQKRRPHMSQAHNVPWYIASEYKWTMELLSVMYADNIPAPRIWTIGINSDKPSRSSLFFATRSTQVAFISAANANLTSTWSSGI